MSRVRSSSSPRSVLRFLVRDLPRDAPMPSTPSLPTSPRRAIAGGRTRARCPRAPLAGQSWPLRCAAAAAPVEGSSPNRGKANHRCFGVDFSMFSSQKIPSMAFKARARSRPYRSIRTLPVRALRAPDRPSAKVGMTVAYSIRWTVARNPNSRSPTDRTDSRKAPLRFRLRHGDDTRLSSNTIV